MLTICCGWIPWLRSGLDHAADVSHCRLLVALPRVEAISQAWEKTFTVSYLLYPEYRFLVSQFSE